MTDEQEDIEYEWYEELGDALYGVPLMLKKIAKSRGVSEEQRKIVLEAAEAFKQLPVEWPQNAYYEIAAICHVNEGKLCFEFNFGTDSLMISLGNSEMTDVGIESYQMFYFSYTDGDSEPGVDGTASSIAEIASDIDDEYFDEFRIARE